MFLQQPACKIRGTFSSYAKVFVCTPLWIAFVSKCGVFCRTGMIKQLARIPTSIQKARAQRIPCRARGPPWLQLPSAYTQELIEDLKADHDFGNSCRKFIPLSEVAWCYKTELCCKLNRRSAASRLDSNRFDGENRSWTYMPLFKQGVPWGPGSSLPCTSCSD